MFLFPAGFLQRTSNKNVKFGILRKNTFQEIKKNNKTSIREELGDLLFTFICLARHLDLSIDDILLDANSKFKNRFEKVKKILDERGLSYASPDEMNQIWKLIKG